MSSPPPFDPDPEPSGVPLNALFLLTAFSCVLAALVFQSIQPVLMDLVGADSAIIAAVVGAILGLFLGSGLGLTQRGPLVGMFIGGPTGFVLGAIVGPMVLVPVDRLGALMATTFGGAVALILVAVVMRAFGSGGGSGESGAPGEPVA